MLPYETTRSYHNETYIALCGREFNFHIERRCIGSIAAYYALNVKANGVSVMVHTSKSSAYIFDKLESAMKMYKKRG